MVRFRPSQTPHTPGEPGTTEAQIHRHSGLRTAQVIAPLVSLPNCIVNAFVPTDVGLTAWTRIPPINNAIPTLSRSRLPYPATPCISITKTDAETINAQFRLTGFDQFMRPVEDITLPVLSTAGDGHLTLRVWCSRVFSQITRIEYRYTGSAASHRINVGLHWNTHLAQSNKPATENYYFHDGGGFGTPFVMSPYQFGSAAKQQPSLLQQPEFLGGWLLNLSRALPAPFLFAPLQAFDERSGETMATLTAANGGGGIYIGRNFAGMRPEPNKFMLFLEDALLNVTAQDSTTLLAAANHATADQMYLLCTFYSGAGDALGRPPTVQRTYPAG